MKSVFSIGLVSSKGPSSEACLRWTTSERFMTLLPHTVRHTPNPGCEHIKVGASVDHLFQVYRFRVPPVFGDVGHDTPSLHLGIDTVACRVAGPACRYGRTLVCRPLRC